MGGISRRVCQRSIGYIFVGGLDYVSSLLHLLMMGQFCLVVVTLEFAVVMPILVELLGLEHSNATLEMRHC